MDTHRPGPDGVRVCCRTLWTFSARTERQKLWAAARFDPYHRPFALAWDGTGHCRRDRQHQCRHDTYSPGKAVAHRRVDCRTHIKDCRHAGAAAERCGHWLGGLFDLGTLNCANQLARSLRTLRCGCYNLPAMGIRDALARAAGPSAFGSAMGRAVVDNGLALGRTLYLGHGIDKSASTNGCRIFDSSEDMRRADFELYCSDPLNRPPMEDQSDMSLNCRAAGIALATHLSIALSSGFFNKQENRSAFNRSMGQASREKLVELDTGVTVELFTLYTHLQDSSVKRVLNEESPGSGDLLGLYLQEAAKHSPNGSVGFQRSGILGFESMSSALLQETAAKLQDATSRFGW